MRVLLWLERGSTGIPGGHLTQLRSTAERLRELGVEVVTTTDDEPALDGFDLVHGFTLAPSAVRRCREAGLPVVLSSVYWGLRERLGPNGRWYAPATVGRRLRMAAVLAGRALRDRHYEAAMRLLEDPWRTVTAFESADLLLPNSATEADTIRRELGVTTPMVVVPNGVDVEHFVPPPTDHRRHGVLCVARIEPHKNQLALIGAARRAGFELTLVGPQHPHHDDYYRACVRAAGDRVRMLPAQDRDELRSLYQEARVHVLPSWSETTGLVSLEAAATGCAVVTTGRGYARDYFGDLAWYCDPASGRSIRDAVESALTAPADDRLGEVVRGRFTWDRAAAATLDAYRGVLAGRVPVTRSAERPG